MTSVLKKTLREDTHGEDKVQMEVEMGIRQPQVKGSQQPAEVGRGKEQMLPETWEGTWRCQHLDFRISAFRTVHGEIPVVLTTGLQ